MQERYTAEDAALQEHEPGKDGNCEKGSHIYKEARKLRSQEIRKFYLLITRFISRVGLAKLRSRPWDLPHAFKYDLTMAK